MIDFITNNLLWTAGIWICITTLVFIIVGFFWSRILFFISIAFFLFSFYFFRNPERICIQTQQDKSVIVCPADGKIIDIQLANKNELDGYFYKVSIFLSAFDVHVNWIPIDGTITKITYKPGAFMLAYVPKSSELNERNDIEIMNNDGKTIRVRQIAGTIARRICCWVQEYNEVFQGQKYGMIRFGSRVEIFLPKNVHLMVDLNQRVYGGQTVLAKWNDM